MSTSQQDRDTAIQAAREAKVSKLVTFLDKLNGAVKTPASAEDLANADRKFRSDFAQHAGCSEPSFATWSMFVMVVRARESAQVCA